MRTTRTMQTLEYYKDKLANYVRTEEEKEQLQREVFKYEKLVQQERETSLYRQRKRR